MPPNTKIPVVPGTPRKAPAKSNAGTKSRISSLAQDYPQLSFHANRVPIPSPATAKTPVPSAPVKSKTKQGWKTKVLAAIDKVRHPSPNPRVSRQVPPKPLVAAPAPSSRKTKPVPVGTKSIPEYSLPPLIDANMEVSPRPKKNSTHVITLLASSIESLENGSEVLEVVSRQAINSQMNLLKDKTLLKIFSYLNPSDLLMCREVQRYWNNLISSQDILLDNIVFVVNICKKHNVAANITTYDDLTSKAKLPFRHARFQNIDSSFLRRPSTFKVQNSDNQNYLPDIRFFPTLTSLEFRNCFLHWKTLKAYLGKATNVTELKIINCHITDHLLESPTRTDSEFVEFKAGYFIRRLVSFQMYEKSRLSNITSMLRKLNGFQNESLESLKITFYPPDPDNSNTAGNGNTEISEAKREETNEFSRELTEVISHCLKSLKVLSLDLQDVLTLDLVGHSLTPHLASLGGVLNLKEFQLSPGLDCWLSKQDLIPKSYVPIISPYNEIKDMHAIGQLVWFLESQTRLEKIGLPAMDHKDSSSYLQKVLWGLPAASIVKHLAVPSDALLPMDLFHLYPSLKEIKIRSSAVKEGWELFPHYTKEVLKLKSKDVESKEKIVVEIESSPKVGESSSAKLTKSGAIPQWEANPDLKFLHQLQKLFLSCITLPINFCVLVENMPNLTCLEINSGFDTPLIGDDDMQLCIKNLTKLTTFVISCANNLTDFGVTGIPARNCRIMFQNQLYLKRGVNSKIWTSPKVKGRPLSDMKGLRKLVLMGKNEITDIGVGYGLAFNELKYCYLPYSDYITEWGIKRIGLNNPSLQSLYFTGVNQFMKEEFSSLRASHERIKRGDSSRCGYYSENQSPFFTENLVYGMPTAEDILNAVAIIGGALKAGIYVLATPLTIFKSSSE